MYLLIYFAVFITPRPVWLPLGASEQKARETAGHAQSERRSARCTGTSDVITDT